jgi:hypothetical protein
MVDAVADSLGHGFLVVLSGVGHSSFTSWGGLFLLN